MTPANGPHQQLGFGFDVSMPAVARPALGKRSTTADRDLATRPHTRLKLDSLRVYAPEWFGVMLNLSAKLGFRSAWFIDAFAGPGRFKDGVGTAPGSPVIACEAARDIAAEAKRKNRDFTPRLRFVEIDRRTRLQLADELKSFHGVVDYEIVAGDAMAKLPRLIVAAGSDPLLTFLDPDGFAPVTFDLVARLGARRAITELLLSVDAHGLRRAQAAKETGALTAFSGGTWWQELLDGRGLLDVNAYLAELRRRIRDAGFTDVGYRHLRFLATARNHRAIIQACGSPVGRHKWAAALDHSRDRYEVVADLFPDLDRHQVIDATIGAFRGLAGRRGLFWSDLTRQLDSVGVEPNESAMRQSLLQLRDLGLADFDRLGRNVEPVPRFTFKLAWPVRVGWDGDERRQETRAAPVPASVL
jgi:three-Cys-motif partner protein